MQPRTYVYELLVLLAAVVVLAITLRLGAGARWFSFYGAATLILFSLPPLGWILIRRYRDLSLNRWPIIAPLLPVGLAAVIQIVFWVVFFGTGPSGRMLAAGRSMVLPIIDAFFPAAAAVMAALIVWLVARGSKKRVS